MSGRTNLKVLLAMSVFLLAVLGTCGSVQADPIGWSITQLTNNSYDDYYPRISGSNVFWRGYDGNDYEIFFYNGNTTTQLTNNDYDDYYPIVSSTNVVWFGDDGSDWEIFFWDGNTTTQLTNNNYHDYQCHISGSNVVWQGQVGGSDYEIFFWDGNSATQLTNNIYDDYLPRISGSNVTWEGDTANGFEIFFWDGNTTQITNNSYYDEHPRISGTNVVWDGVRPSSYEIFFWDGNTTTQLTNDSYVDQEARISGSSVVWEGYAGGSDYEIFFWDGDPNNITTQVTNNSYHDRYPKISGSNVVWHGYDGSDYEIFLWDGSTTTQLTDNSYDDKFPRGPGSKVVWHGYDGNDYEIFMATALAIDYYVDDNSPGDPAPGDPSTSDPLEDGSMAHPFDAIQEAITAASDGNTICVLDGTYTGTGNRDIDFVGKAITVRSIDPNDPNVVAATIIDCNGTSGDRHRGFDFHSGEDANSVLDGFTIKNGYEIGGGAIRCVTNSSPTIRNCVISGNTATNNSDGGGIRCHTSNATITNCTISGNTATRDGAGIWCYSASGNPTISSCTISDNNAGRYGGGVYAGYSSPTISNCTISNNTAAQFGGGIFSRWNNSPTISDSTISDNSPEGIWIESTSTPQIAGIVQIISNNVVGDGTVQIDPDATLNLDDAEIFCNMSGPGTMEVDVDAELIIDGNAVIDLGDPCDPNVRGTIDCNGFLEVKDNAQITNANINVTRASFTDDVNISNSVITVSSRAPYGQFFIDANASFVYNDIYADGDRYMDMDPNIFTGLFANNRIFVTITEGVGQTQGGLFELRGEDGLVSNSCDVNEYLCQVDPCTIPECNLTTWTIERLELIEGAKLNLINRFGFQWPYDFGAQDEVLYVKELILRQNSVLNTTYNRVYYETRITEPNAVIKHVPLLGFSLINIALDDDIEFIVRVMHNNFIDPEPDPCDYTRIHAERVEGNEPDLAGMMLMRNLVDLDPCSSHYQQVINARAKGMFAKSGEDDILILFEYLFDTADPNAELAVYLSDVPELLDHNDSNRPDHYIEIARLSPPSPGRPGSAGSDKFTIFSGTFPSGDLNFIRGTYIELELAGSGARCLINNWDPTIRCNTICGDYGGFPPGVVNIHDYLLLLAEYGLFNPTSSKGCLDLINDGQINIDDLQTWYVDELLNLCELEGGAAAFGETTISKALQSMLELETQSAGGSEPLLIFGKPPSDVGTYMPNSYLYGLDPNGTCRGNSYEPACPPSASGCPEDSLGRRVTDSGRFVTDSDGNIYQINSYLGLIRQDTATVVVEPNVDITYSGNLVSVGIKNEVGLPLADAAFKPGDPNTVYVVPVLVKPPDGNCPYMAAAKLELIGGGDYYITELYGKNPATQYPQDQSRIPNPSACPDDARKFAYEPDVLHFEEVEIDSTGNLYILSTYWTETNTDNWVLIYDEASGNSSEVRVQITEPNLIGPTAMVVSSSGQKLYLASSVDGPNEPNDLVSEVYRFSIDKVNPSEPNLIFDTIIDINCPEPNICITEPNLCDSNNFIATITSMIENPGDGTVYAMGFTAPKFPDTEDLPSQIDEIFTTPMLAAIPPPPVPAGLIEAEKITGSDLFLPLSIVWTAAEVKCGGADLDGSGDVNFTDFAKFAEYWRDVPCDAGNNWCGGADFEPDGDVDTADLAILALYWLETGCLD